MVVDYLDGPARESALGVITTGLPVGIERLKEDAEACRLRQHHCPSYVHCYIIPHRNIWGESSPLPVCPRNILVAITEIKRKVNALNIDK